MILYPSSFCQKEPENRIRGCRVHILRRDFLVFQIARGSRATLSECTYFKEKVHITSRLTSKETSEKEHFTVSLQEELGQLNLYPAKSGEARGEKTLEDQPRNARGLVHMGPTRFFIDTIKALARP
jgi:hypothetical protein